MHTQPVNTFGAVKTSAQDRLKNLREEAIARLKSLRERPDPNLVPQALLKLREDQKYALVVDAKRSRLYVYENRQGVPKFVTDYYISQGKLGVDKHKEGDQKTPLGVYYITGGRARERGRGGGGAGARPGGGPGGGGGRRGRGGAGGGRRGAPAGGDGRPPRAAD